MITQDTQAPATGGMGPRRAIAAVATALTGALALGAALVAFDSGSSSPTDVERDALPAPAAVAAPAAAAAERVPVYLVASAEEAAELRRRLAVLTFDGLPREAELIVAGSAEEEAGAQLTIQALYQRFGMGGVAIVDLRAPGAESAMSYMPPCDGATAPDAGNAAC